MTTKKDRPDQPSLFETTKRQAGVTVFARCPECGHVRIVAISLGRSWCEIESPERMAERHYCDRPLHGDALVRMTFDHNEPLHVKRFDDETL